MWAGCLLPFGTRLLGRRARKEVEILTVVVTWCSWMFFFNELAYFGPAAGVSPVLVRCADLRPYDFL